MTTRHGSRAEATALDVRGSRAWHASWPDDVPLTREYPRVPAWWLLEHKVGAVGSRARRTRDRPCHRHREILSYEALFRAARGTAAGLKDLGVTPGSRVGLVLPNSNALIIGYYATWLAGGLAVPANPSARETRAGCGVSTDRPGKRSC